MNRFIKPDCNRCSKKYCKKSRQKDKMGMIISTAKCASFIPPADTFKLVEMVLSYPTSLNKALSQSQSPFIAIEQYV